MKAESISDNMILNGKIGGAVLTLLCAVTVVLPCVSVRGEPPPHQLRIVTTIFPEYDWVRNIAGTNAVDLTLLVDGGTDLHSYQPTARALMKIAACDLFVCVGGASDAWTVQVLKSTPGTHRKTVRLLDMLKDRIKEERLVEGMQAEEEESVKGEPEYDEHIWLSLRLAETACVRLAECLADLNPAQAAVYRANAVAYCAKLRKLDGAYRQTVTAAPIKTLLFGDRFPFRYLADDYGLTCYAAFPGCSAETEASFKTIAFLARKVNEKGLHTVMTLENVRHRIAPAVVRTAKKPDLKILSLNAMQSVTAADVASGVTYLSIMEKNLVVLREALR